MRLDVMEILQSASPDCAIKWQQRLPDAPPEYDFVFGFAPLFDYVLLNIEQASQVLFHNIKNRLSERVLIDTINESLLPSISHWITRVCVQEMQMMKKHSALQGATPQVRYQDFLELLADPQNLQGILKKYPLLNEQLALLVEQFQASLLEMLTRLNQDWERLADTFFSGQTPESLHRLQLTGDKHNQGRQVILLEFDDGAHKLVYKPRSLAIDAAFGNFLNWFNDAANTELLTYPVLNQDEYGWCGFAEALPCQSEQDVTQFYQELGTLLALIHLLGGTDLHCENLIAAAAHPVIIDCECLLRPFMKLSDNTSEEPPRYLVTEACILPKPLVTGENSFLVISALAALSADASLYTEMKWELTRTDEMRMVRKKLPRPVTKNHAHLHSEAVNFLEHTHALIDGFTSSYQTLLANKSHLQSESSPLVQFAGVPLRLLFRPTHEYGKLLYESNYPELLFSRSKREAHFSWLTETALDCPSLQPLLPAELQDLAQGNIPIFYCMSDNHVLFSSQGKPITIEVEKSAYTMMQHHLNLHMNEADLALQTQLIENAFNALTLSQGTPTPVTWQYTDAIETQQSVQLKQQTLGLVEQSLEKLLTLKIENRGRVFWPTLDKVAAHQWEAGFTDIHLYNGLAGIMLSFAYAGHCLENSHYQAIAKQCLASLRQTLALHAPACLRSISAFSGVCGVLYSLASLYRLWGDNSLKQDIHALLQYLPELIDRDTHYDFMHGAAGCLRVMHALQGLGFDEQLNDYATLAFAHLMQHFPNPTQLPDSKPLIPMDQPLLGLAHGTAGIAFALAGFNQQQDHPEAQAWLEQALQYERVAFDESTRNWPDYRRGHAHNWPSAWCHGAAGIGLARFGMRAFYSDSTAEDEIAIALTTTLKHGFGENQTLCHGDLGNLELFLTAAKVYQDNRYNQYAERIVSGLLTHLAAQPLHFTAAPAASNPGLMTGQAGLVYQLLRFNFSDQVPNILLLDN